MSETAGTSNGVRPIPGTTRSTTAETAHEAYSFACMRCGHGWEQAYDIEHHTDGDGRAFVVYFAGGARVPSPLTSPDCGNCGGNVVRIMRAGRVSSARSHQRPERRGHQERTPGTPPGTEGATEAPAPAERHHWHLSDLLHPFQHHRG